MNKFKEARKAKGWTQEELARKVYLDQSCISEIECGYYFPNNRQYVRLCQILEIDYKEQRKMEEVIVKARIGELTVANFYKVSDFIEVLLYSQRRI